MAILFSEVLIYVLLVKHRQDKISNYLEECFVAECSHANLLISYKLFITSVGPLR